MNTNLVLTGPTLTAHHDDGSWWAECPGCPGWTAVASTWEELFRLVTEWHESPESPHQAWMMFAPIESGQQGGRP